MNLLVYHNGQEIHEFTLIESQEYIAGRSEDCDIVLSGDQGISRQHIKFYFDGNNWCIELLSRFGELLINGKYHEQFTITGDIQIYVPPFEVVAELNFQNLIPP